MDIYIDLDYITYDKDGHLATINGFRCDFDRTAEYEDLVFTNYYNTVGRLDNMPRHIQFIDRIKRDAIVVQREDKSIGAILVMYGKGRFAQAIIGDTYKYKPKLKLNLINKYYNNFDDAMRFICSVIDTPISIRRSAYVDMVFNCAE